MQKSIPTRTEALVAEGLIPGDHAKFLKVSRTALYGLMERGE